MKVKRCPICAQELLGEDGICRYCGKIYCQFEKASLMDRNSTKTIKNIAYNRPILYVTDKFFAFDKEDITAAALTGGGAAAFGAVGAVVGGLTGDAISAARKAMKRSSTAICYDWKSVISLSYPMQPWPAKWYQVKLSADQGIDVQLKDGSELAVWVAADARRGKELYEVMNMLHQKSISEASVHRSGGIASGSGPAAASVASSAEPSRLQTAAAAPAGNGAGRIKPVYQTDTAADSRPIFFKCPSCGITQMREGNSCSYCGKPVPTEPSGMQSMPGQQPVSGRPSVSAQQPMPKQQILSARQASVPAQQSMPGQQTPSARPAVTAGDQKTCPSCGIVQEEGNKFCVRCGQKLSVDQPKGKFCPHCGMKVTESMLFCGDCGTRLG